MDIEAIRKHCLGFPHATENVQWGADLCFKIDGKMFAVASLEVGPVRLSFKCTPENFAELCERRGIIPAPYLARAQWVALQSFDAVARRGVAELLTESYWLVWQRLPKKRRIELAISRRCGESDSVPKKKDCSGGAKKGPRRLQRVAANEAWTAGGWTSRCYVCSVERRSARLQPAAARHGRQKAARRPQSWNRQVFAIVREGDALRFLGYVPEDGVNLGRDAVHDPPPRSKSNSRITLGFTASCLIRRACLPPGKADAISRKVVRTANC